MSLDNIISLRKSKWKVKVLFKQNRLFLIINIWNN